MSSFLQYVYLLFNGNRRLFYMVLCVLCIGMVSLSLQLHFEEDITKAILHGNDQSAGQNKILSESGLADKLLIMISDESPDTDADMLVNYAAVLSDSLRSGTIAATVKNVYDRIDEEQIQTTIDYICDNLPVFLDAEDYKKIDSLLLPHAINSSFALNYTRLLAPEGTIYKSIFKKDPLGISSIVLNKLSALQPDSNFELYQGYIISKNQRQITILIDPVAGPSETYNNGILLDRLDQIISHIDHQFENKISAKYHGGIVYAVSNARQIKSDIIFTVGLALCLILLLLWMHYREVAAPLIIILPVLFGMLFSLSAIFLIKGKISLIAMGAGAVVLGIAIDYALHMYTHIRHTKSILLTIEDVSMPLVIGSISTVGAFFSLTFVNSELLQDFGIFCGMSLIGSMLFTLIFLPQFITPLPRHILKRSLINKLLLGIVNIDFPKKWLTFFVVGTITVVLWQFSDTVVFEKDLAKMNYLAPKYLPGKQIAETGNSGFANKILCVVTAQHLDSALISIEIANSSLEVLKNDRRITHYTNAFELLPSIKKQEERIRNWNTYWTEEKKNRIIRQISVAGASHNFAPGAFADFTTTIQKDFSARDPATSPLLSSGLFNNFITYSSTGEVYLSCFISPGVSMSSRFQDALQKIPNFTVIDKSAITKILIDEMHQDFNQILWISSMMVFLILLVSYGRIELAIISFVPMIISWIWITGLMALFGLKFNVINIIIATFIFGLGDDFSIFITDGLLQESNSGRKNLASYKIAIILSSLTTIIGIGVLIFAQHPVLQSIATISIIGIISVLVISGIIIPVLFHMLIGDRIRKSLAPLTFSKLVISGIVLLLVVIGFFILFFIRLFIYILPVAARNKDLYFHYCIMLASRTILYMPIHIKKTLLNTENENFRRPAVIISNHQSIVDIALLLMLYPKLIMITNQWVWQNPILGPMARILGFVSTTDAMDENIDRIGSKVAQGYSIVCFPEGTRSLDGTIGRFHKGAFYLAEKLSLPILPIMIHGTGDCIPKNDSFILNPGHISLQILPRINPDNGYVALCKSVSKLFKSEYAIFKKTCEPPEYFANRIGSNYIYKGPITEWYTKTKLWMEDYYRYPMQELPTGGLIVDLGCGYGIFTILASLASSERRLIGIDHDAKKIETATYSYLKSDKIRFVQADLTTYGIPIADAYVLLDVLIYMDESIQQMILNQCMNKLLPNGVIIIRHADSSMAKKHKRVKFFEFISMRLLKFNKSQGQNVHFIDYEKLRSMVDLTKFTIETPSKRSNSSNTYYCLRHKQL